MISVVSSVAQSAGQTLRPAAQFDKSLHGVAMILRQYREPITLPSYDISRKLGLIPHDQEFVIHTYSYRTKEVRRVIYEIETTDRTPFRIFMVKYTATSSAAYLATFEGELEMAIKVRDLKTAERFLRKGHENPLIEG